MAHPVTSILARFRTHALGLALATGLSAGTTGCRKDSEPAVDQDAVAK